MAHYMRKECQPGCSSWETVLASAFHFVQQNYSVHALAPVTCELLELVDAQFVGSVRVLKKFDEVLPPKGPVSA